MTLSRRIAWTIAVLLCFLFAAIWLGRIPDEPSYEGRPLVYYLDGITYGDLRREREAREAIQAMGASVLPRLIEILEAREGSLASSVKELLSRQRLLHVKLTPLRLRQTRAALACQELGPAAESAIPALTRLADDPALAERAIAALAHLGPRTFPILTNVLRRGIPAAQVEAAGSLRYFRPPQLPVPSLLLALQDTNGLVRAAAAETLGVLAAEPATVVPALRACLDDPFPPVRERARESLVPFAKDPVPR